MIYDRNTRTFKGKLKDLDNKRRKVASIQIDCGEAGVATFKLTISRSPKGNPQVAVKAKKPKTGEFKSKMLMAIPEEVD